MPKKISKKKKTAKKTPIKTKDMLLEALMLGFGLMDVTKEKVEEQIEKVRKDKNITKEAGKRAVEDLLKKLKIHKSRKEIENIIRTTVKKAVDELGLATKDDLKKLEGKLKK